MKLKDILKFFAKSETASYLEKTKNLFVEFDLVLQEMIAAAQKASVHISQYIAIVAQENVKEVLKKLEKYQVELQEPYSYKTSKAIRSALGKEPNSQDLRTLHTKQKVIAKITEHLERAQEALSLMDRYFGDAASFLPEVPAHPRQAQRVGKLLTECNKILGENSSLGEVALSRAKKSWFTAPILNVADLIDIRVSAYGLNKDELRQSALTRLENLLDQNPKRDFEITKITKGLLRCKKHKRKPASNSLYYQFVPAPKIVTNALAAFKELAPSLKEKTLTKEQVLSATEVEFPKPLKKYTAGG